MGRATVTIGRTPHSPAGFFEGAGGDGYWLRLCSRSSKAELTDNTSRRQMSLGRDNLQAAAASGKSTCRMRMTAPMTRAPLAVTR